MTTRRLANRAVAVPMLLVTSLLALSISAMAWQSPPTPDAGARRTRPLSAIEGLSSPTSHPAAPSAAARETYARAAADLERNVAAAISRLDRAITEAGGVPVPRLRYLLARCYQRQGAFESALPYAEQAVRSLSGVPEAHYLYGALLVEVGRRAEAIPHLRTAAGESLANNPSATAAWFALGSCLAAEGYLVAAVEALERFDRAVWQTNPEHRLVEPVASILAGAPHGAALLRYRLLRELGRIDAALAALASVADEHPDDLQLARTHVDGLLEAGRTAQAVSICRARIEARGDSPGTASPLLRTFVRALQRADELDGWITELAAAPDGAARFALHDVAQRCESLGFWSAAARVWEVVHDRQHADRFAVRRFRAMLRAGEGPAAVEWLSRQIASRGSAFRLPSALHAWCVSVQAADVGVLPNVPDDASSSLVLAHGLAALLGGRVERAESLFRLGLERSESVAMRHALGISALARYGWEEARNQADTVLEAAADDPTALFVRALASDGLDNHADAIRDSAAALRAAPTDAYVAHQKAALHERLDHTDEALNYYDQAFRHDPLDAVAAERIVALALGGYNPRVQLAQRVMERVRQTDLPGRDLGRIEHVMQFARTPRAPEAIANLIEHVNTARRDGRALQWLIDALLVTGRWDEVGVWVARLREVAPRDDESLRLFGEHASRELRFDDAVAPFETLGRRYPNRLVVQRRLQQAYLHAFRPDAARSVLVHLKTVAGLELRPAIYQLMFETYRIFQDWEGLLAALDGADEQTRDLFLQTRYSTLVHLGRSDEAVAAARAALARQPGDITARMLFLHLCLETRAFDELLGKGIAWHTEQRAGNQYLAVLLEGCHRAKRYADGLALLDATPRLSVGEDAVLRGPLLAGEGDVEQAVAVVRAALRRNVGNLEQLRETLVRVLVVGGRYDEALGFVGTWRLDDPLRLDYQRLIHQAAGRDEEYVAACEKLLQIRPQSAMIKNDLGYVFADQGLGDLDRALRMIREAVATEPLNAAYLDSLAWAYYKRGDFDEASHHLRRAVQLLDGQDCVQYDHLGDSEYRRGATSAAVGAWNQALALARDEASRGVAEEKAALADRLERKLAASAEGRMPPLAPLAAKK